LLDDRGQLPGRGIIPFRCEQPEVYRIRPATFRRSAFLAKTPFFNEALVPIRLDDSFVVGARFSDDLLCPGAEKGIDNRRPRLVDDPFPPPPALTDEMVGRYEVHTGQVHPKKTDRLLPVSDDESASDLTKLALKSRPEFGDRFWWIVGRETSAECGVLKPCQNPSVRIRIDGTSDYKPFGNNLSTPVDWPTGEEIAQRSAAVSVPRVRFSNNPQRRTTRRHLVRLFATHQYRSHASIAEKNAGYPLQGHAPKIIFGCSGPDY
jgi:hypothetical protein